MWPPEQTWQRSSAFFAGFAADDDRRGRMSAISLWLLEQLRPRWADVLDCYRVMGFGMVFSPPSAPYTDWVRIEPDPEHRGGPVISVSLLTHRPFKPGQGAGSVVGGDVCSLAMAPAVVESFLLQLAEPSAPLTTAPPAGPAS